MQSRDLLPRQIRQIARELEQSLKKAETQVRLLRKRLKEETSRGRRGEPAKRS